MRDILFEIEDDMVIKNIPDLRFEENVYKQVIIIDKETFIECYNKWILEDKK